MAGFCESLTCYTTKRAIKCFRGPALRMFRNPGIAIALNNLAIRALHPAAAGGV